MTLEKFFDKWINDTADGMYYLDNFADETQYFKDNPAKKFELTNFFVNRQISYYFANLYEDGRIRTDFYEVFKDIFEKRKDDLAPFAAYMFNMMNAYKAAWEQSGRQIFEMQNKIRELEQKLNEN